MNPPPENPEQIRTEIDATRRRMDDTFDALGERLRGRHLLDEVIGFFRSDSAQNSELRHKLSDTIQTAADSLVNTVKANPIPLLLVGAGVGWMIYENRRKHSENREFSSDYEDDELYSETARNYSDPDALYDRPLDYPPSSTVAPGQESLYGAGEEPFEASGGVSGKLSEAKNKVVEKASHAKEQVKETLSRAGERVREKSQAITDQARNLGARVQEGTREMYSRGRERVVHTTHEHPLEVGLACLALGVIAGLALPTPEKARQLAGPTVDRLRERTRRAGSELLDKGERVARAAVAAARDEARAQGLTFEPSQNQPTAPSAAPSPTSASVGAQNPPSAQPNLSSSV